MYTEVDCTVGLNTKSQKGRQKPSPRKMNKKNNRSPRVVECCAMLFRTIRRLQHTLSELFRNSPEQSVTTRTHAVFLDTVQDVSYIIFRSRVTRNTEQKLE